MEKEITNILKYIGEDIHREGVRETPKRVEKAFKEIFAGYRDNPDELVKLFDSNNEEPVLLKNIEFYSMCEHHMLPFFGKVNIAYIPNGKVIGVSKLARVVNHFSKRLQIQERLVDEIADFLYNKLNAKGVAVFCKAEHLCMKMRGIKCQNSVMATMAMRGTYKQDLLEKIVSE